MIGDVMINIWVLFKYKSSVNSYYDSIDSYYNLF